MIVSACAVDETDGVGGHVWIAGGGSAYVDAVEFFHMGQMGKMGRYPLHWHLRGDAEGQYVQRSSFHDSFQRCVTVHGTSHVLLRKNLCYNTYGHGFFLEDGNEMHNTFEANIAILNMKMPSSRALLQSDFFDEQIDRFPAPASFWVSHPTNVFVHNVAIASEGTGFWMSFLPRLCCTTVGCSYVSSSGACARPSEVFMQPAFAALGQFDHNEASSCLVGMNWDGVQSEQAAGNPLNPTDRHIRTQPWNPPVVPNLRGLRMYKNSRRAMYHRGSLIRFQDCVFADNGGAPLWAFNSVLSNSVCVGWSRNAEIAFFWDTTLWASASTHRHVAGANIYDGPLIMRGVHFAGFPAQKVAWGFPGFNNPPPPFDITPAAIATVGAAARFFGASETITFGVQPYYRMLYANSMTQAAVILDVTGDLTGEAGSVAVSHRPINRKPGCVRLAGLVRSISCPGATTSLLRFEMDATSNWMMRFVRTAVGTDPENHHPYFDEDNGLVNRLVMFQNAGFAYHVTEWSTVSNSNPNSALKPALCFQANNVGDVSPPIYLRHYAGCTQGPLRIGRSLTTQDELPTMSSEADLLASNRGGVFYAAEYTVVRLVADTPRVGPFSEGAPAKAKSKWEVCCGSCGPSPRFTVGTGSSSAPSGGGMRGSIGTFSQNEATGTVTISGYACLTGNPNSVGILVTCPTTGALVLDAGTTQDATEVAILNLCDTPSGSRHRFTVTLTAQALADAGVDDWQLLSVVGVLPGSSGWYGYISMAACVDSGGEGAGGLGTGCAPFQSNPQFCLENPFGGEGSNFDSYFDDADFSRREMCCACGGGTTATAAISGPTTPAPSSNALPSPETETLVLRSDAEVQANLPELMPPVMTALELDGYLLAFVYNGTVPDDCRSEATPTDGPTPSPSPSPEATEPTPSTTPGLEISTLSDAASTRGLESTTQSMSRSATIGGDGETRLGTTGRPATRSNVDGASSGSDGGASSTGTVVGLALGLTIAAALIVGLVLHLRSRRRDDRVPSGSQNNRKVDNPACDLSPEPDRGTATAEPTAPPAAATAEPTAPPAAATACTTVDTPAGLARKNSYC